MNGEESTTGKAMRILADALNQPTPEPADDDQPEEPKGYTMEDAAESVRFIVDMMNNGNVDPKQVYPSRNRYYGD